VSLGVLGEVIESAKDARDSAVSGREKLEEQKAMMKNAMATIISAATSALGGGSEASTSTAASAGFNDISSQLIRKRIPLKRPAESTPTTTTLSEARAGEGQQPESVSTAADAIVEEGVGRAVGEYGSKDSEGGDAKKPRLESNREGL